MTSRSPGSSSATRMRIPSASHGSGCRSPPSSLAAFDRRRRPAGGPQSEDRTDGDRAPGMVEELVGNATGGDDRIAPVVEVDELRQKLGAHAVPIAGDPA